MQHPHYTFDEWPDHGSAGYEGRAGTGLAELYPRLPDLGFRELNNDQDDYSTTYKRSEGAFTIYIVVTPRNKGKNRVMHISLDNSRIPSPSTFDLNHEYADALMRGRDNEYMFNAF